MNRNTIKRILREQIEQSDDRFNIQGSLEDMFGKAEYHFKSTIENTMNYVQRYRELINFFTESVYRILGELGAIMNQPVPPIKPKEIPSPYGVTFRALVPFRMSEDTSVWRQLSNISDEYESEGLTVYLDDGDDGINMEVSCPELDEMYEMMNDMKFVE